MGSARPIWLMRSGGVRTAATMKTMTRAYFRFFLRVAAVTSPTRAIRVRSTGSWKQSPKAKISFITRERYSPTRASSWIGKPPPAPVVSKLRKNCQARGKIQ